MINKKSIWFLTLFSLILVLSVYYITMPSELLLPTNGTYLDNDTEPVVNESTILVALQVEADETFQEEVSLLQDILTNSESTIEEKNEAFNKMKELNNDRSKEENIEKKIKETYTLDSFVKIKGDQIEVVIKSSTHDTTLANNIMRTIQEDFDTKLYITVRFTA